MPQDVHRLKDIQVEEVSLVDRAANKRRFLLVKRDADMDLKPNGRGGFTRVAKADDDEDAEKRKAEEAEKAKAKPAPEDKSETDTTAAARGGGDVDDEEKRKAAEKQITQLEAAGVDVTALKAIFANENEKKRTAKADANGKALAAELADHIEALEELCEQLDDHEDEEPSDQHMEKLMGCHKAIGETIGKYAKKGKSEKMGKTEKTNFAKALDTLTSLLGELLETPAKTSSHNAQPGDPQGAPKGWSAANPSGVPTGEAGTAGGFVGKRDLDELKQLVKRQADEIATLKKNVAPGNSRSVERVTKSAPTETSWPMDMNDERYDRSKVDKSTSFYDD